MSADEVTDRIRKLLASKRGPELVDAIATELGDLYAQIGRLSNHIRQMKAFHMFSERMSLLKEKNASPIRLPKSVCIDAAQLFEPENGFYPLEYESNGQAFRWTGPRPDFSFTVYVDRTKRMRIRLEVAYMMEPAGQSEITVLVDGEPFSLRLEGSPGRFIGEVIIPGSSIFQGTHLVFVVPKVLEPNSENDKRSLGVAFRKLAMLPCEEEGMESESVFGPRPSPQHALLARTQAFAETTMCDIDGQGNGDANLNLVRLRNASSRDQIPSDGDRGRVPAIAAGT